MAEPNEDWAARIRAGDRRAVSRAISLVESGEPSAIPLLKLLFPSSHAACVLGITGSPGAGKSTLVEKLAAGYSSRGLKVGILAVDPTSPFSGGALLGDRIRMQSLATHDDVYIRSMATRGCLGGIAAATGDAITVLEAAGCQTILVETVGVGQDEVEVATLADATLVILVPGMGDDVQALKAGILEIADVFIINKSDQPGADRLERELRSTMTLAPRGVGWTPPVLQTVATTGQGLDGVEKAIEDFRTYRETGPLHQKRQREKWRRRLLGLIRQRLFERWDQKGLMSGSVDAQVERIARREQDPYSAAEELIRGLFY
ncbi:MAG TPA: methylmalonyl Co-A mutase-associated GTPase MeaB [Terriglobia bacterium]|nr:methylmalonyl Co-A mutase-associated GTPase MeaB [Terriglobia bacterium]